MSDGRTMLGITDEWGQRGVLRARCPRRVAAQLTRPSLEPLVAAPQRGGRRTCSWARSTQPPRWPLALKPSASQVMLVWKSLSTAALVSSCTMLAVDRAGPPTGVTGTLCRRGRAGQQRQLRLLRVPQRLLVPQPGPRGRTRSGACSSRSTPRPCRLCTRRVAGQCRRRGCAACALGGKRISRPPPWPASLRVEPEVRLGRTRAPLPRPVRQAARPSSRPSSRVKSSQS